MRDNMENKGWRENKENKKKVADEQSKENDTRGWLERQRVADEQDHEVDALRRKFGVTSTKVLEAIRAVGTDRHALEEYLRNQIGGYDPKRDMGPRE